MTGTLLRKTLSAGSLGAMLAVLVVIGCFACVSKAQEAAQLSRVRACLDTRSLSGIDFQVFRINRLRNLPHLVCC